MSNAARLVRAEELERYPEDDHRYELVTGRVIRMSPVGLAHGQIAARQCALLHSYTVRAPDMAVIRRDRLPSPQPKGFLNGPPDLAVEVLSPDDRPEEIQEKVLEYLARGVSLVLVIDAETETATVSTPSSDPRDLRGEEMLDLDAVVPGFRRGVRELFD